MYIRAVAKDVCEDTSTAVSKDYFMKVCLKYQKACVERGSPTKITKQTGVKADCW